MDDGVPRMLAQTRIDTFAYDPVTRESRRRTEYSGSIWFGEPPSVMGQGSLTVKSAD